MFLSLGRCVSLRERKKREKGGVGGIEILTRLFDVLFRRQLHHYEGTTRHTFTTKTVMSESSSDGRPDFEKPRESMISVCEEIK